MVREPPTRVPAILLAVPETPPRVGALQFLLASHCPSQAEPRPESRDALQRLLIEPSIRFGMRFAIKLCRGLLIRGLEA